MAMDDAADERPDYFEEDAEVSDLVSSPEFWKMIAERRREPTIPWEEAKRRLEL
jgi:hypothetical protein